MSAHLFPHDLVRCSLNCAISFASWLLTTLKPSKFEVLFSARITKIPKMFRDCDFKERPSARCSMLSTVVEFHHSSLGQSVARRSNLSFLTLSWGIPSRSMAWTSGFY